jgi:protein gp37
MSGSSTIEWTEATWNPLVGCTKVSPGCTHCYAERMSARLGAMAAQMEREGQSPGRKAYYRAVVNRAGKWSRTVQVIEDALEDPLRWRSPKTIFVNSMSDLFHEGAPETFIRRVFEVMEAASWHTFQVLTKRPERAREMAKSLPWPSNVWFGTSVENESVMGRIQALRKVPAHIRFLSLEPLLGPLPSLNLLGIRWVIVGGESGPRARPMKPEWVRPIRDKALAAGVPFFFKQWGGRNKKAAGRVLDGRVWNQMPAFSQAGGDG